MEQEQKAAFVRKLESMRAEEAAPGFDREDTWAAIAARLDAPAKKRKLRMLPGPWRFAAAALVAGLLLGGGLVAYLLPGKPVMPVSRPVAVARPQGAAAPAARPETTAQAPAAAIPARVQPATPERKAEKSRSAVAVQIPVPDPTTELPRATPPAATGPLGPVEPASAGVARARAPRAVHLLDLESEDRTVLLDRGTGPDRRPALQLYLSARRMPPAVDNGAPSSVLRALK